MGAAGDLHQFAGVLHVLFNPIFTDGVEDCITSLPGTGKVFQGFQQVRREALEDFEQDGTQQVNVGLWTDTTGVQIKQFGSGIGEGARRRDC